MKFSQLVSLLESDNTFLLSVGMRYKFYSTYGNIQNVLVENNDIVYADSNQFAHNDNGPAVVTTDAFGSETKRWFKHGKSHRIDGPAVESFINGELCGKLYCINGVQYSKNEFDKYVKGLKSKEDKELLGDLGQTFD